MAYTTQAACEIAAGGLANLVDLCDQDGTGSGALNEAVLTEAITATDGWIDSYVAKQRAVPLSPVPDAVARLAAQEAVYRLKANKPRPPIGPVEQQRHDENLKWLEGIASGRVTLGVDPQPAKSALVSPAVVLVDDADAEITACNTKGFW